MKRNLLIVCLLAFAFTACKNETKKEESSKDSEKKEENYIGIEEDGLSLLRGEFIYVADAAVLKGNDFIYGVELDSMATVLSKETESLKRDEFDMVPVIVKGKIKPNPMEEGWEEVVEIKKIIKVFEPSSDSAITVKGDKNNKEKKE